MNPSPGWFPDPSGRFAERYWDGKAWTASVRSSQPPPPPEPRGAQPPPPPEPRGAQPPPPPEPHRTNAPPGGAGASDQSASDPDVGRATPPAPDALAPTPRPPQPELPPPPLAELADQQEAPATSAPEGASAHPNQLNRKAAFWIGVGAIGLFIFWQGTQDAGTPLDNKDLTKGEAAYVVAIEQHEGYDASASEEANWARYGHSVCRELGRSRNPAWVAANLGMSPSDGNFIVSTATKHLCPQYR